MSAPGLISSRLHRLQHGGCGGGVAGGLQRLGAPSPWVRQVPSPARRIMHTPPWGAWPGGGGGGSAFTLHARRLGAAGSSGSSSGWWVGGGGGGGGRGDETSDEELGGTADEGSVLHVPRAVQHLRPTNVKARIRGATLALGLCYF
jgi:hypothetical protein